MWILWFPSRIHLRDIGLGDTKQQRNSSLHNDANSLSPMVRNQKYATPVTSKLTVGFSLRQAQACF